MGTSMGVVLLGLLVVLAVAGMVVWAWQQSRRNTPPSLRSPRRSSDGPASSDAPYSAENAASWTAHNRGSGPGGGA